MLFCTSPHSWLEHVLYQFYLFIVLTVLLSLLIAQMTDTYANVQGNAQRSLNLSRAWIVARFEHNARFIVVSSDAEYNIEPCA